MATVHYHNETLLTQVYHEPQTALPFALAPGETRDIEVPDEPYFPFLLANGAQELKEDLPVAAGKKIDGKDVSALGGFDPETQTEFYEEFIGISDAAPGPSQTYGTYVCDHGWSGYGTMGPGMAGPGEYGYSAVQLVGKSPDIGYMEPVPNGMQGLYTAAKNPVVKMMEAQYGSATSTRRFGLADNFSFSGEPINGIYIRHVNNGHYVCVCRSGDVESVIDTTIHAAAKVFHKFRMVITATSVEFFMDGVSVGTITTNIPTGGLGIGFMTGSTSTSGGILMDYIHVVADR